jgi:hypothetical protein
VRRAALGIGLGYASEVAMHPCDRPARSCPMTPALGPECQRSVLPFASEKMHRVKKIQKGLSAFPHKPS